MFHLVEPGDRAPARGSHAVDLLLGVAAGGEQQRGGPLGRLRGDGLRLLGVKADLDPPLRGGADGDTVVGGSGNDAMFGGDGSVTLLDDGDDFLNGNDRT